MKRLTIGTSANGGGVMAETEIQSLAERLGLHAEPYGDCWRLLSPTGVPLFMLAARARVGGGRSWHVASVLDLASVGAAPGVRAA